MRKLLTVTLLIIALTTTAAAALVPIQTNDQLVSEYLYWCSAGMGANQPATLYSHITIPANIPRDAQVSIHATAGSRGWADYPYEARLYSCSDYACTQPSLQESKTVNCPGSCGDPCDTAYFNLTLAPGAVRHYKVQFLTGGVRNVMLRSAGSTASIPNQPPTEPHVTTPANGSVINPAFTLGWDPSMDPEGDPITYQLETSTDGSVWSWSANTTDTSASLDWSQKSPGEYLVRLTAFDSYQAGPNTTMRYILRGAIPDRFIQTTGVARMGQPVGYTQTWRVFGTQAGPMDNPLEHPEDWLPSQVVVTGPNGEIADQHPQGGLSYWTATSDGTWTIHANTSGPTSSISSATPLVQPTLDWQTYEVNHTLTNPTTLGLSNVRLDLDCPGNTTCIPESLVLDALGPHQSTTMAQRLERDGLDQRWGDWQQDPEQPTIAGGTAYIRRGLTVVNAFPFTVTNATVNASNMDGWRCDSLANIDVLTTGYDNPAVSKCRQDGAITATQTGWQRVGDTLVATLTVNNTVNTAFNEISVQAAPPGGSIDWNGSLNKTITLGPSQSQEVTFTLAVTATPTPTLTPSPTPTPAIDTLEKYTTTINTNQAPTASNSSYTNYISPFLATGNNQWQGATQIRAPKAVQPGTHTLGVFDNGRPMNGTVNITSPSRQTYNRTIGADGSVDFDFDRKGNWTIRQGNATATVRVRDIPTPSVGPEDQATEHKPDQLLGLAFLQAADPRLALLLIGTAVAATAYVGRERYKSPRLLKSRTGRKVQVQLENKRGELRELELTELVPEGMMVGRCKPEPDERKETIFGTLHRWKKARLAKGGTWKVRYQIERQDNPRIQMNPARVKAKDPQGRLQEWESNCTNS